MGHVLCVVGQNLDVDKIRYVFYSLLNTVTLLLLESVWLFLAGLELVCAFMVETGLDMATQTHTVLPDTQTPPGTLPPPDFPSVV